MLTALRPRWTTSHDTSRTSASRKADSIVATKASVQSHTTTQCRKEFLRECWHVQLTDSDLEKLLQACQSYFLNYEQFCSFISLSHPLLVDCTHENFCQAAQHLKSDTRSLCEAAIQKILPIDAHSSDAAHDCINFIGEAILLINLSEWTPDETLSEYLARSIATKSSQQDQYRIPLSFNARSFEKVAGIKIIWTRNLLSHLEIGLNDSNLSVFHNMKVLELYEHSSFKDVFPDKFLDETRCTLSLMLPVIDEKSMKWFATKQQKLGLDPSAGTCRHLRAPQRNIQDFNYWRDRLIIMKEAFDLSQPDGLFQFWRDNRNKAQWWTFWIAIIVFLLTVIGVVEGALQVYKGYHPS